MPDQAAAIAVPAGRVQLPPLPADIDTPQLVVYLDRVAGNIRDLQAELDARGVRLRPHAKTHKSVGVARLQLEAGAVGITVGTLGEAEVFVSAGFRDVFIAYPIWAAGSKGARLRELHAVAPDLAVGIDSAEGAACLAAAIGGSNRRLRVLIEIDSGGYRSGVRSPDEAAAVAKAAREGGLAVAGVFTHGGHGYAGPDRRAAAAADEVRSLAAAANALESAGFDVEVISAGSTPTMLDAATGRVNEVRPGTYVLGDRLQVALGSMTPDRLAAVVAARVVSINREAIVLDSGAKCLTKDLPALLEGYGELPDCPEAVIERLYDYHAVVRWPRNAPRPGLGETVRVVPNHICPVVDLFDSFLVVHPGGAVDRWPVDARGRSG